MKTITEFNNFNEFFTLREGEHFIYRPFAGMEFFAVKVGSNAILINGNNKFIVAKAYKNILSIGSGTVRTYDDFETAKSNIDKELKSL